MLLISTSLIQSQQWFLCSKCSCLRIPPTIFDFSKFGCATQHQYKFSCHRIPPTIFDFSKFGCATQHQYKFSCHRIPPTIFDFSKFGCATHTNTNSVATASHRRPSASQNVVVQPSTNTNFIPVVRGSYVNYNPAGTTFNNPNVVVQSRPVVVPTAPVISHINNGYNPSTRNTMNQHTYGNYGSKCAPSKSSQISCHGKLN